MPRISELNRTELREFLDRMLIYTKSLTRHLHDAEDLLQNSLVKALSKDNFDGTHLKAWFRTIILNTFRDNLRKYNPVLPNNDDFDAGGFLCISWNWNNSFWFRKMHGKLQRKGQGNFILVGKEYTSEK